MNRDGLIFQTGLLETYLKGRLLVLLELVVLDQLMREWW